jgi:hypothetical protein
VATHRIDADTAEEANAVHHIKMGWEPNMFLPANLRPESPTNQAAYWSRQVISMPYVCMILSGCIGAERWWNEEQIANESME